VPHFTLQFQTGGPQLHLYVGVSQPRQQALKDAGLEVPQPILIRGLVDTGASSTAVDPTIIEKLGLSATGAMPILTPSTGDKPHQANTFDVSIAVPLPPFNFNIAAMQVFESSLNVQGIQALIGRDILANCLLVYDGRANIFSLAF
jgi:hypothetical protein